MLFVVTTAWPTATVTFATSDGRIQTETFTACKTSDPNNNPCTKSVGAVTQTHPDAATTNGVDAVTGFATVAITMINTNGTFPAAGGKTGQIWDPQGPNFQQGLEEIAAHETGHTLGLGDQSQCGDVMSAMGGTNNAGNCATGKVCSCDQKEIQQANPPCS